MKKFILCLIFLVYGTTQTHETDRDSTPAYYTEFTDALFIISTLHSLVNETALEVKSATALEHGSLKVQCHPEWNSTDKGLIAYFEEGHPTKLYSPFGTITMFWRTERDPAWQTVNEKFNQICPLNDCFVDSSTITHQNAYGISSIRERTVVQPTHLFQGDQKRKDMLAACIEKFMHNNGTLPDIAPLSERKARLKKVNPRVNNILYDILTLRVIFNMFDLSD